MAVAYLDRKIVSRSKGQSIIAKAAYNACAKIKAKDGTKDFRQKSGLAFQTIIMADQNTPPIDRAELWNGIEEREKRKDAQLGYTYEIALPKELTREQNIKLAQDFTRQIIKRYNFEAADLCIHYPTKRKIHADKTQENPHIHLLTPTRDRQGKKLRLYGDKDDLIDVRALWQETVNRHLEDADQQARIDMRRVEIQQAELDAEIADLRRKEAAFMDELKEIRLIQLDMETLTLEQKEYELDRELDKIQLAEFSADIAALQSRETAIIQELKQIRTELSNASAKSNTLATKREDQGTARKHGETEIGSGTIAKGHLERDRHDQQSAGQAGRAAGQGGSPGNQGNAGRHRRTEMENERDGNETRQRDATITAAAKHIARRIEMLRFQRQAQAMANPLSTLARRIASRIDGARYEREHQYIQQDSQEAPRLSL